MSTTEGAKYEATIFRPASDRNVALGILQSSKEDRREAAQDLQGQAEQAFGAFVLVGPIRAAAN